jgi:hypothetical protein
MKNRLGCSRLGQRDIPGASKSSSKISLAGFCSNPRPDVLGVILRLDYIEAALGGYED